VSATSERRAALRPVSLDAIVRHGLTRSLWHDAYHALVGASWPRFLAVVALAYGSLNVLFAIAFSLQAGSIANAHPGSLLDMFFFSVQTLATIGYGAM